MAEVAQSSSRERMLAIVALIAVALSACHAPPLAERRISAPEARQGAASDGSFVYAIDNHRIGKYAISRPPRRRVEWDAGRFRISTAAQWSGESWSARRPIFRRSPRQAASKLSMPTGSFTCAASVSALGLAR